MMMSEPAIGVLSWVMMRPQFRRRAVVMMSQPAIGVAVVMMVVGRLFRERHRRGEDNHRYGKGSNN
jgi:hypothetical protein